MRQSIWFFFLSLLLAESLRAEPILLPLLYYTPETSLAAGFISIHRFDSVGPGRTSQILASGSLTSQGQSLLSVAPKFFLDEGKYELGGVLFYSYFPYRYYGVGLSGTLDEPEKYTEINLIALLQAGYQFQPQWFLRGSLGFDKRKNSEIVEGGKFEEDLQNYSPEYQTTQGSLAFEHDTRDIPPSPNQGTLTRLQRTYYLPENLGNDLSLKSFIKDELEFRLFHPVRENVVLAWQVLLSDVKGPGVIPFHYLNTIGGGNRLRGYYAGRFRERSLAMTQLEARYHCKEKWTLTSFVGSSQLAENADDLFSEQARSFQTVGVGARYLMDPKNRTSLRFDLGFAAKSVSVYFLVGEAF